jgi:hypothetical protein
MRAKKRAPAPIDPRLQRVLDVLEDADNAARGDSSLENSERTMYAIVAAASDVEHERWKKVIALLWADNDNELYSHEEDRRVAMMELAEKLHRQHCKCCARNAGVGR